MKFRDFINETRFKGLKRAFIQAHPGMPSYVASDIYNSRVGFPMRRSLDPKNGALAPTEDLGAETMRMGSSMDPRVRGGFRGFRDVTWTPRPTLITVGPLDFDQKTIETFLLRQFGFKDVPELRDDTGRTLQQWDIMADARPGRNEPIIVVKDGNKYSLLEGWHRTMAYLLYLNDPNKGAPQEQIDLLQKGNTWNIDLKLWRPVTLQAYVGIRRLV